MKTINSCKTLLIRMLYNDIATGRTIVKNSDIQTEYANKAFIRYNKLHSPETWARAWRSVRSEGLLHKIGVLCEELPGSKQLIIKLRVYNPNLFEGKLPIGE